MIRGFLRKAAMYWSTVYIKSPHFMEVYYLLQAVKWVRSESDASNFTFPHSASIKIHYYRKVSSRSIYSKRFISIRISTKILCAFLAFLILASCSVRLTFHYKDSKSWGLLGKQYKLRSSSLKMFSHAQLSPFSFEPSIFPFSDFPNYVIARV
jgi:hypothetical protein